MNLSNALTSLNNALQQSAWVEFLNYAPLPELMQGAGVAILTLLVSFAIGIILHHFSFNNKAGGTLDLHVALDYVWMFKPSLIPLLLVVIVPFTMGVDDALWQTVLFGIWSISLALLVWIVIRLYGWVKGNKHARRLGYLAKFPKSTTDKIVSWNDLWSTSNTFRIHEQDYFVAFSQEIDALMNTKGDGKWNTIAQLLTDFFNHIDKRDRVFLLVFEEFFPKILKWQLSVWRTHYSQYSKDLEVARRKVHSKAFEVDLVLDQIIRYITKEALVGPNRHPHTYFTYLEQHIETHKDLLIEGPEHSYQYIGFIPVYEDCFEFIPQSPDSYHIWEHYFPLHWKINRKNLDSNAVSRVWLHRYLDWSQSRIWKQSQEWDKSLEELNKGLFDDVDPITWAKIHTFVFKPRKDSDTKMRTMVEQGVNFGLSGRVFSGAGDDFETQYRELQKAELENTIDLALQIFPGVFTQENIKQWQGELAELQYSDDSDEGKRVHVWRAIFKKMLERV